MAKLSGKLSVLMPAYNEETIIYANALEAARQISPLADDYELLVIDDGSSDRTKAEIERAAAENPKIRCISYQPNQGKGGALREGTAHATGDYIAFCDADLDLAPEQLADFIDRMQRENADVVIGSKMHPESKVDYPAIRLNCTPFVRQYGILFRKWGVFVCQKEYQTNDIRRNSREWL